MPEPSTTSLLPVLVGGLLTMGGGVVGFVGALIRDLVQSKHDTAKRRAEKFEELVAALYEFDHWIENIRQVLVWGKELPSTVSPFATVQSISAIYFPQFDGAISKLDVAAVGYRVWMAGAGQKRLSNELQAIREDFPEAYRPYAQARDELLDALKKFAHKTFQ